MGIRTWLHKRKFNKVKKLLNQEILKIWADKNGQQCREYFNDYFMLSFKPDACAPSCDKIAFYWRDLERTIDRSLEMDRYIDTLHVINWHFCTSSIKELAKYIASEAYDCYKVFDAIKIELIKYNYLIKYKLVAHMTRSGCEVKASLTPYIFADYIKDIKDYYKSDSEITADIVDKYKEFCLKEFAKCSKVNADEPTIEPYTIEQWYKKVYLPKVDLDARTKECQNTIDEINKTKEKNNK